MSDFSQQTSDLVRAAQRAGATAADAVMFSTASLSITRRMRSPEHIERSESTAIGLRVFVGHRQAIVSSSDTGKAALSELVERALAVAKAASEDHFASLAPEELLATTIPDLDLFDANEPSTEWLLAQCALAEEAALATPGITNSEGAEAQYSAVAAALAASNGFSGEYRTSHASISASVLAGEGTNMERDYDYATARHLADLRAAETIGKNAASYALRRLNPRKVKTCEVPIVFDPRVGKSLLSGLAGAVSGAAIARGTSFLKDKLGQQIFAKGISVIDDPLRIRGLGSRPFDAEGVAVAKRAIVEDGVLATWLLDMRAANQLKLTSTGHASRGLSSPPHPSASNLYLAAGALSPQELIADIKQGFYVTEAFGMGVNLITGDYSQGASGLWIENGELSFPVSELTIAGHLSEMFRGLTPASDLAFRYGVNAPTLRVERMTVAGI